MVVSKKKKLNENDVALVAFEISINSLLCLYKTNSDIKTVTNMLLKRKSELQLFFKSNFDSNELINILKLLVPVYNLPNELIRHRSEILSTTHSDEFLDSLKKYLLGLKIMPKNKAKLLEELIYIVWFLDANVNELPISHIIYNKFWALLEVLYELLKNSGFQKENVIFWVNELILLIEKKIIHKNRASIIYKEMSIYPQPIDLFENKDLNPNKTVGAYVDITEYLDIHYKLLKEDFESNLREGLFQLKAELKGGTCKGNSEIHVFHQVSVESLETDKNPKNSVNHKIIFKLDDKKESNDPTKIFLNGALLVFSEYSQFSTFILAKVIEAVNLPEAQKKLSRALRVSVIGDPSLLKVYHKYTVVGPRTFFEPYHQVLKAIHLLEPQNFPMMKYIVHSDASPFWPSYIDINTEYSFKGRKLKLFGKDKWPENLLNLSQQQIDALQAALTYEFVLIQGPPGTGKTFLAENIIRILIENKHFLSTPILLISSKNDSVDQILEPFAKNGKKVVRLGGQSKSDVLKKCAIFNVIRRVGDWELKERINKTKNAIRLKMNNNENIEEEVKSFNSLQKSYFEFCEREDARLLLAAKVEIIGGTTAGCARLRSMLDNLKPEVIIVEDANEVLESHVIASLAKGCKHVILLGDDKQLRPNVANNKCSSDKYNLDVSLFERMVRCGMKCCTLTEQKRMRPEIASLICPTIYSKLLNHPGVRNIPNIKGMRKNLYFINHEFEEEKVSDTQMYQSYCNKHEGDMLLALADYLIKQGYSVDDITILSPFAAQQSYIKQAVKNIPSLQNIQIQLIDSYSGQENMIILLSFVRSKSSTIGFLTSNNRINVALSRAKAGLYIIGNMKTLSHGSNLWSSLNDTLKRQNAIGKSIELQCQNHQTVTSVTTKEDFKNLYNFGCQMPCRLPLSCGHLCKLTCHPLVDRHKTYVCREPCTRLCQEMLHGCKKRCHEKCDPCKEILQKQLPCGHDASIYCFQANMDHVCDAPTEVLFLCFFQMTVPCFSADSCFYSRIVY